MAAKALSVSDNKPAGCAGCAVVFCVLLLAFSAAGTYVAVVQPLTGMVASRSWNQVPCKILSSNVKENRSSDGSTYRVEITYRYSFGGRSYVCDRYNFMFRVSSSGRSAKQKVVNRYPVGSEAICFVNPAAPESAVLDRSWTWPMLLGLIPLSFFVGGLLWLYRIVRYQATDAPNSSAAISAATEASQLSSFDQMPDADIGPLELTPESTPARNLLGTGIFAVIWNLIIGTIVFAMFMDGDSGWFMVLFMVPFVLVGVGLALGTCYYTIALLNPVPILTLSHSSVPLAGTADLQWRFRGSTNAIQRLQITVKAVEKATYVRGTDIATDTETFYEHSLLDASGMQPEIIQGDAEIFVPSDMMHSFKSEHNEIAWSIVVHGDIPWRPDVKSEFLIQVRPHDA